MTSPFLISFGEAIKIVNETEGVGRRENHTNPYNPIRLKIVRQLCLKTGKESSRSSLLEITGIPLDNQADFPYALHSRTLIPLRKEIRLETAIRPETPTVKTYEAKSARLKRLVDDLLAQQEHPPSMNHLIYAMSLLWFEREASPILDAILKRENLQIHHLLALLRQRHSHAHQERICDAVFARSPSIADLRFIFSKHPNTRKRIASILAEHPDAGLNDLTSAMTLDDLNPGCRERLEERIRSIAECPASRILSEIETIVRQSAL